MMNTDPTLNPPLGERLSALMDGELTGEAFAATLADAQHASDSATTWATYHLIGDVLRGAPSAAKLADTAFASAISARIEHETRIVRPAVEEPVPPRLVAAPPANAWRWKIAASVATVAAFGAVGWNFVPTARSDADIAQGPAVQAVAASGREPAAAQARSAQWVELSGGEAQPAVLRDPRLDELLAAHKQDGAASAFQMPAGFIRNATFVESPGR